MPRARNLTDLDTDVSRWPHFDASGLPDERRAMFEQSKRAVTMYIAGISIDTIKKSTGMDPSTVRKLVDRCRQLRPDGTIEGFAALVPYRRRGETIRRKANPSGNADTGYGGSFRKLLLDYPILEQAMISVLSQRSGAIRSGSAKDYAREVHGAFLQACTKLGLHKRNAYPFNTNTLAVHSVRAFVRDYVSANLKAVAPVMLGRSAEAKLRTQGGQNRPVLSVFERVEADAHLLDHALKVMIRHPNNHYVPRKLRRLWVVVLVEVRSRAVLGYALSLGRQPNHQDLLDAVHMALSPWHKYHNIPDFTYGPVDGFPSEIRALRGVGFRELSVDGAKMNFAKEVTQKLEALLNAKVTYLNRGTPDDRPYIERFFEELERRGFHRMAGTTGSHPKDPRRSRDIDLATGKHRLDWENLPALLDHIMAAYNGTPHGGLGDISPLEFLRQQSEIAPHCRTLSKEEIDRLQFITVTKTIRGNLTEGRAPYIEFEYARYGGGPLSQGYNLIGQRVQFRVNAHDGRYAFLYTLSGEPLGRIWAAAPWHDRPVSLRLRALVHKNTQARARHVATYGDPILQFAKLSEEAMAAGKAVPDGYLAYQRSVAVQAMEAGEPLADRQEQLYGHDEGCQDEVRQDRPCALPLPRMTVHGGNS